jgi:hypothetical protein
MVPLFLWCYWCLWGNEFQSLNNNWSSRFGQFIPNDLHLSLLQCLDDLWLWAVLNDYITHSTGIHSWVPCWPPSDQFWTTGRINIIFYVNFNLKIGKTISNYCWKVVTQKLLSQMQAVSPISGGRYVPEIRWFWNPPVWTRFWPTVERKTTVSKWPIYDHQLCWALIFEMFISHLLCVIDFIDIAK